MDVEGKPRRSKPATILLVVVVALAIIAGVFAYVATTDRPSTSDASIDADVVHVAATVGGRVVRIGAVENGAVRSGALLYQIDPAPYRHTVAEAEAALGVAIAEVETRRRQVFNQRETARTAAEQRASALANRALASRTVRRLEPLAAAGYVTMQQLDQARTQELDAGHALAAAINQENGARVAVDTVDAALAEVRARQAALATARYNLAQTTVSASRPGRIVGLKVSEGEIVTPSQSLFTLVDDAEWFAEAYFRETQLAQVRVGDCATVYSMVDRGRAIAGRVQGIGAGVGDQDSVDLPRSLPAVERSLNWVRVAQRFPVRIRLDQPPADLMRLGASAVVQMRHGPACPRQDRANGR